MVFNMEEHIPVLLGDILRILRLFQPSGVCIDATLGHGGYSAALLAEFPEIKVIGLDRDKESIELSEKRLSQYKNRFFTFQSNYCEIQKSIEISPFQEEVKFIIYDLGVSTLQITSPNRGFSFQDNGPLDMRMDATKNDSITAYHIINNWSERDLSDVFYRYGEEKYSRYISRGIVQYREKYGSINNTEDLVGIIRRILPQPVQRKMGGHPARRVFQSLRIAVNNELESLEKSLINAQSILANNGIIFVVSYHSLEDKIAKKYFSSFVHSKIGYIYNKKVITPSPEEVNANYRSRSAKMRVFIKSNEYFNTKGKSRWTDPLSL